MDRDLEDSIDHRIDAGPPKDKEVIVQIPINKLWVWLKKIFKRKEK